MENLIYIPLLFVCMAPALYGLVQYNRLIALRNHVRESWADIDTELKRRYDLIPRLVEVARGYAAHERTLLADLTALRERCAANHGPVSAQSADEAELSAGLRTLLARVEAYPDLKADTQFQKLHAELVNTEDRIQAARRFYNGNVRDYRNSCETFPSSLIARLFSFPTMAFFTAESAVAENPRVDLPST